MLNEMGTDLSPNVIMPLIIIALAQNSCFHIVCHDALGHRFDF